jgi:hypothetical protein
VVWHGAWQGSPCRESQGPQAIGQSDAALSPRSPTLAVESGWRKDQPEPGRTRCEARGDDLGVLRLFDEDLPRNVDGAPSGSGDRHSELFGGGRTDALGGPPTLSRLRVSWALCSAASTWVCAQSGALSRILPVLRANRP